MKLAAAHLIALTLLVPLAAADQDVSAGPAHVVTTNSETGDECGGDNGYHSRLASAEVEIYPGEYIGAGFSQSCSDQSNPFYENHGSGFFVNAYHRVDNNYGPQVYVGYSDADMNGWHMCGLYAGIAGVPLFLGCLPADTAVPMVPALP